MKEVPLTKKAVTSRQGIVFLALFVASFLIRFVYLNQIDAMPTFTSPVMDEKYHVELAHQINSPEGLTAEPYYRAPLYPYFLAAMFRITHSSFYWTRFIQIIIGSFLPLIVFALGLRVFDRRIALWAAIVAAVYPTFLYFDASLLITSLMVVLTALLGWQLYRCQASHSLRDYVLAGVLLGLSGLTRPNILLLGPALFLWIWLVVKPHLGWKKALGRYVLLGIMSLVVILPVTIRNYAVSKDVVFIAWQGGFNFFLGNNRYATGWSATAPGIDQTWEGGYRQAIAIAEQEQGRALKRSEVSDYWYGKAWQEIKRAPGAFLALAVKKVRLLLNGYEIPNNQDIYGARQFAFILKPLLFRKGIYFPFGVVVPFAVIGIFLSFSQWRKYLLLYLLLFAYSFSLVLFFVCARYRQPLIPFLILFAVYAVSRGVTFVKNKQTKHLIFYGAALLVLGIESNHNLLGLDPKRTEAENHHTFGNAYLAQNNVKKAEEEFRKAIAVDSTFALPYNNLGMLAAQRRQTFQAIGYFRKALELDPSSVETYLNLASVYAEQNDYESAIAILKQAIEIQPYNDFAHLKLGTTYYTAGKLSEALAEVRRSVELNPDSELNRKIYRQILQAVNDSTGATRK